MPEASSLTADRVMPRRTPGAGGGGAATAADSIVLDALRISLHRSVEEGEPLWRTAATHCAGLAFQSFDWQSAYQATIGRSEGVLPLIVHVADQSGRTLLILPLGIYRRGWLRVLRFLGGVVTDYNAPLIDPDFAGSISEAEFAVLWHRILDLLPPVDLVWLRRMPEVIDGWRNPLARLPGAEHTKDAHAAALPAPFEAFKAQRGAKLFRENGRQRRRLAERGAVETRFPDKVEDRLAILDILARQKSRRWRETGARDMFPSPGYLEFYRRVTAQGVGDGGRIHVGSLEVDGLVVATNWAVIYRRRFYDLLGGYEAGEWARLSVARLLVESIVQWCIEDPEVAVYDLTVGAEAYKHHWADHSLAIYELLAPRSRIGRLYVAYRGRRARLKRNERVRALARRLRSMLRLPTPRPA